MEDDSMSIDNRPLSPHLQIYKPQITSILSITHRGTGVFLSIGAFCLTFWLLALADGAEKFNYLQAHINSWYGLLMIYGFIFSLYFHLCNGIRHLCWDIGLGLEIETTYITGYVVIISSSAMTLLTFIADRII